MALGNVDSAPKCITSLSLSVSIYSNKNNCSVDVDEVDNLENYNLYRRARKINKGEERLIELKSFFSHGLCPQQIVDKQFEQGYVKENKTYEA